MATVIASKPPSVGAAIACLWIAFALSIINVVALELTRKAALVSTQSSQMLMPTLAANALRLLISAFIIYKLSCGKNWARVIIFIYVILYVVGTLLIYIAIYIVPNIFINWRLVMAAVERSPISFTLAVMQIILQVAAVFLLFTSAGKFWFKPPNSSTFSTPMLGTEKSQSLADPDMRVPLMLTIASVALFMMCLALPGYYTFGEHPHTGIHGCMLLLLGWLAVPSGTLAWLANPAILCAWMFLLAKEPKPSFYAAVVALGLILTFLVQRHVISGDEAGHTALVVGYDVGFWLWLLSALVQIFASGLAGAEKRPKRRLHKSF